MWVSPPDPSKNHVIARRIHFCESAEWFTQGRTFKEWDHTGGLLWIHGKRGCFITTYSFVLLSLMTIFHCSGIGEEHIMVSAPYISLPISIVFIY